MSYNHQPQLSVNSVQSLVEPVTPPSLGQMNNKRNHQKTHSLDLSGFNQFMSSQYPMALMNTISPNNGNVNTNNMSTLNMQQGNTLPLIDEFDISINNSQHSGLGLAASVTTANTAVNAANSLMSNPPSSRNISNSSSNSGPYNENDKNPVVSNTSNNSTSSSMIELSSTPLEDLDYVKLATDQFGCRFLQKKLESNAESDIVRDLMYEQIKPYILDLILDPFGNYLIQKLCDYLTTAQRTDMIQSIFPQVFQISINQYGTRSLQKIIDTVDSDVQIETIIKGFSQEYTSIQQVVTLINDLNGNHVIQKCIFKFPPSTFGFVIDAIVEKNNIITISTHKHGCCVLQKLLSVCTLQQIFTISVKIIQFLPGLINDQFGNYIIQFLLDIDDLDYYLLPEIFKRLSNELCQLSCLKFSSNVVEKFIKKLFRNVKKYLQENQSNNDEVVQNSMNILLSIVDIFTLNLNVLIRDNFGNYALQTLLDVKNYSLMLDYPGNSFIVNLGKYSAFSHEFTSKINSLIIQTKELLPSIKTTSYAKKIKLKVKAYAELTGLVFPELAPKKVNHQPKTQFFNNYNSNNAKNKNIDANINNNNSSINNNGSNPNHYPRQHARHFSLPANAYHRRSNSSASSSILSQQQQPDQQSSSSVRSSIFNNQNVSPLNYQQQQQQQSVMMPSINQQYASQPAFSISTMTRPASNMSLQSVPTNVGYQGSAPQLSVPQMYFRSDSISAGSSSSTLYQNNNVNSINNNPNNNFNDIMPNPMMQNMSFTNNFKNDASGLTQTNNRIISNPLPQPGFLANNNINNVGSSQMQNMFMNSPGNINGPDYSNNNIRFQ